MKIVEFTVFKTTTNEGECFIFLFYVDGMWDEWKWTLEEALHMYPLDKYTWVSIDEKEFQSFRG